MPRVLFHSFTSKYLCFAFVPADIVYAGPHVVIALSGFEVFAILQSSLHNAWVWMYCSTMRTDIRYAPSDLFETFPLPECVRQRTAATLYGDLAKLGEKYYSVRAKVMQSTELGLTKTYNRFHDPDKTDADIQKLRELHVEMDQAVATAYGWTDLDLGHGFHETKQGVRFTITEVARRTLRDRLLRLNHERYAEEVKTRSFTGKEESPRKAAPAKRSANKLTKEGVYLFDMVDDE